jgi:nicotinamidase-related amidase
VSDTPNAALVVVDVLQTYDFEDVERLLPSAEAAVPVIRRLIGDARSLGLPVIYVNDAFGDWGGERSALVRKVLDGPHAHLVRDLVPPDDAVFVAKARHSILFETPLAWLLREQGIDRLVLCGQVTEQCILSSALDAHVRQLEVVVARDACAHIDEQLAAAALRMMEENMAAVVVDAGRALDEALGAPA